MKKHLADKLEVNAAVKAAERQFKKSLRPALLKHFRKQVKDFVNPVPDVDTVVLTTLDNQGELNLHHYFLKDGKVVGMDGHDPVFSPLIQQFYYVFGIPYCNYVEINMVTRKVKVGWKEWGAV